MINPPTTAVNRVDLFRQNNITAGEIARDTQKDVAAKHPVGKVIVINGTFYTMHVHYIHVNDRDVTYNIIAVITYFALCYIIVDNFIL